MANILTAAKPLFRTLFLAGLTCNFERTIYNNFPDICQSKEVGSRAECETQQSQQFRKCYWVGPGARFAVVQKNIYQITHLTLSWYNVFNCTNGSSLCCRWSTQRIFFFDVACCDVCCVRIVFVFFFPG